MDSNNTGSDYGLTARAALRELGSPKQVRQHNLSMILEWIFRWGYSTADILSDILGRKNRSHARRLADSGWLKETSIRGYPTFYTLTERALAEVYRHQMVELQYKEIDPYGIDVRKFHHNIVAQSETMMALRRRWIFDYETERMLAATGNPYAKQYDVLWIREANLYNDYSIEKSIWSEVGSKLYPEHFGFGQERIGIEIELTPKWKQHLDAFATNILTDVEKNGLQWVIVISDSKIILKRYSEMFSHGNKVPLWRKTSGGKSVTTGIFMVMPENIQEKVLFRSVGWQDPPIE